MKLRKKEDKNKIEVKDIEDLHETFHTGSFHDFQKKEITQIQKNLLKHYEKHARKLEWRKLVVETDDKHQKGYLTWVSEIMLQQTRVIIH